MRFIRSFKIERAKITVITGYNDESTAATSSLPTCVAIMKKPLPRVSRIPVRAARGKSLAGGRHDSRVKRQNTPISSAEARHAVHRGQSTADPPAPFLPVQTPPTPTPPTTPPPLHLKH